MREYTISDTIIANIPYVAMVLIGVVTIVFAYGLTPLALMGAGVYLVYGVAGAFWIIFFVCPYCAFYASKGCPCGYGILSAKIRKKGDRNCFPLKKVLRQNRRDYRLEIRL